MCIVRPDPVFFLPGCYSGQTGQSDVRECLNPVPLVHSSFSMFV